MTRAQKCRAWALVLSLAVPVWAEENRPTIGTIDFYGLRTVTKEQVRVALGIKEGDAAPVGQDTKEAEKRLEQVPLVTRAKLSTVKISGGKIALFVGIEEKGAPTLQYGTPPTGSVVLPKEMVEAEDKLMDAWNKMVQTGVGNQEDDSQGHALMQNPAVRAGQQKFIQLAASGSGILREVLKNSADSRQRQIAAWILGYAPDKRLVIGDLVDAVSDPDPIVRNNATRSIGAIAVLANRKPELEIHIDPKRFIEMLNSLDWSDRNKASKVLVSLSQKRPAELMATLQKLALPSMIEMASWKAPHGEFPFTLLARIAGLDENDIHQAWEDRGERESVIAKAARPR